LLYIQGIGLLSVFHIHKLLDTVNSFCYLGYPLPSVHGKDIPNKVTKFIKILGTINSVMKPSLVQKQTKITIYKTLFRTILTNGHAAWTIRKSEDTGITAAETQFMMHPVGEIRK
jgi:hypothetical protein